MILIAFRHGLRASELCDLRWDQVEFGAAVLHVRRVKNGTPGTGLCSKIARGHRTFAPVLGSCLRAQSDGRQSSIELADHLCCVVGKPNHALSPLATQGESVLPRRNPTTLSRALAEFHIRKAARRSHG